MIDLGKLGLKLMVAGICAFLGGFAGIIVMSATGNPDGARVALVLMVGALILGVVSASLLMWDAWRRVR